MVSVLSSYLNAIGRSLTNVLSLGYQFAGSVFLTCEEFSMKRV